MITGSQVAGSRRPVAQDDPMVAEKPKRSATLSTCVCERPTVVSGDELGVRCFTCGRPPSRGHALAA